MLKPLQYSFRILTISFSFFFFNTIYYIVSLYLLFFFDIISSFYTFFYFQYIFLLFFFIGFFNLFYVKNYMYSILFFFYSLFLLIHYVLFYNFTVIPEKNTSEFLEYLEELEDVQSLEEECYICLENKDEKNGLKYLNCSHCFHPSCLLNWFQSQQFENFSKFTCPVCKKSIFIERVFSV